jgi:hypothetical protein
MPSVTLTYADLATRLGRSEDAVKSLVKRKRWRRSVGNDGLARVTLDEAELVDMSNPDRRGVGRPPANSTRAKAVEPRPIPVQPLQELHARIAAAEALATERLVELDAARQTAALHRDDFERERARADHVVDELVAITSKLVEAERARSEAAAMAERARAEADAALADLQAWRSRPWWRRLAR